MRNQKRRKGRRRLFILCGVLLLALVAAAATLAWVDGSVEAHDDPYPAGESTATTTDDGIRSDADVVTDGDVASEAVDAPSNDPVDRAPATTDTTAKNTPTTERVGKVQAQAAPAAAATGSSMKLRVYFVQGEKLVAVTKTIAGTTGVGAAALKLLFAGPSRAERSAGFSSAVPEGTTLRGLSITNGLATVDLSSSFTSGGGTSSMYLRLGQLVYTLTEFPTVDRVKIRIEGKDLNVLGGEGLVIGESISRVQYDRLIGGSTGTGSGGASPQSTSFNVYFVHGEKLIAQARTVPYTPGVAKAAVEALLAGPTAAEKAKGMSSAVPANVKVDSVSIKAKVATVDLSREFAGGGGSQSMYMRLGQVVYTLTQFPTVERVQFRLDGKDLSSLGGEGLLIPGPLSRSDWAGLIR